MLGLITAYSALPSGDTQLYSHLEHSSVQIIGLVTLRALESLRL